MKRYLLFVAMVATVTLCAHATDRFYIEDFAIAPGETQTVSIMLDNEVEYTAFQCDIYLPAGLTASNIVLTDRKHSSHTLTPSFLTDGGIRLLCYSLKVKPFTGNSGALVTMDVTASDDFAGNATATVTNSLFTTVQGVEVPFNDEVSTVSVPSTVLIGDVNDDKVVDVDDVTLLINVVLGNTSTGYNAVNANVHEDNVLDVDDVTALIKLVLGIA